MIAAVLNHSNAAAFAAAFFSSIRLGKTVAGGMTCLLLLGCASAKNEDSPRLVLINCRDGTGTIVREEKLPENPAQLRTAPALQLPPEK